MMIALPLPELEESTTLTAEQKILNAQASEWLKADERYEFTPPVNADGAPAFPEAKKLGIKSDFFQFSHGRYIGYVNEKHIFHGYPLNDKRRINPKHKLCMFAVDFLEKGSKPRLVR